MGDGSSPFRLIRSRLWWGSGFGTADSRALAYGWRVLENSSSVSASSIIFPRYMTPMRSETYFTTLISWAINRNEMPSFSLKS